MGIIKEYFEGDQPLPKFIPLGTVECDSNHIYHNNSATDVRTVLDVPSRLYLGDLDSASFTIDNKGWRAKYIDAVPDTWTLLEYNAEKDSFHSSTRWRGKEGWQIFAPPDDGFKRIARAYKRFPPEWDELAAERLFEKYLIAYQPQPKNGTDMCGFPDGHFMNIVIPTPVIRMREGISLLVELRSDTSVKTPVLLYYTLCGSKVLYCLDRGKGVLTDEYAIPWHVLDTTGFFVLEPATKQVTPEGLNILGVVRLHYALNVGCTFRELERVMEVLARRGFVGRKEHEGKEGFPCSAEFKAVIYHEPNNPVMTKSIFSVGDQGDTRRVQYGAFTMLEIQELAPLMLTLKDAEASMREGSEKISFVERKASDVRDQLIKKLREAGLNIPG